MLETIITALLPIVVTLMLGYFAGWERSFSQDQASVLNRMVMLYALPLMLFAGILSTSLTAISQNIPLFIWTAIGMIGGLIIVFALSLLVFRSTAQLAALRAIAIAGPAVPFIGTPVLGMLYPNDADIAIATGSLLMNLVQVPLALIFLVGNQEESGAVKKSALAIAGDSLLKAIKQPVVWAPVLAFILLLCGLEMPRSLKGSFTLLGQATGGVALFAVGIVLFSQKVSVSLPVIINVIGKNLLLPGIILAIMLAVGVPSVERGLVAVTLAIPTASIAVIFAVEYKCGTQEMASTLFWSTILSILTMGMFIWMTA
ncbi:AEC family transporter [Kerstersia similis]|uniref:AEC family transporter n=1 Tax=Kerstersia similis TaxID=206505 RepID=UPI0039EFB1E8